MATIAVDRTKLTHTYGTCYHCGGSVVDLSYEKDNHKFCCNGCLSAYTIINDEGAGHYYRYRDQKGNRPDEHTDQESWISKWDQEHALQERVTAVLKIAGLHCASCVWVSEKILSSIPGLEKVNVSLSGNRIRFQYLPAQVSLKQIQERLGTIGYRLIPDQPEEESSADREMLSKIGVAAFATGNIMIYSVAIYAGYFTGMDRATRNLFHFAEFLLASLVMYYSARVFFRGAWASIRALRPGMDILTSAGLTLAYITSLWFYLRESGEVYFDGICFVTMAVLTGRYFESKLKKRNTHVLDSLGRERFSEVILLRDHESRVRAEELQPGDRFRLRRGETVPVESSLYDSVREFNESFLTGESKPIVCKRGQIIPSGAILLDDSAEFTAECSFADANRQKLARIAAEALCKKPRTEQITDRIAIWFISLVVALAAGNMAVHFFLGHSSTLAILSTVSLLIAACPCALSLSVPSAFAVSMQAAFQEGIITRDPEYLVQIKRISSIVFDKTGTLTSGRPELVAAKLHSGVEKEVHGWAAALQVKTRSRHPLAKAFLKFAKPGGNIIRARQIPGAGIVGILDDREGKRFLMLTSSAFLKRFTGDNAVEGEDIILSEMIRDRSGIRRFRTLASYRSEDQLRTGMRDLISILKKRFRVVILSGDSEKNAKRIAGESGISKWYAAASPLDKDRILRNLQKDGKVMMVGDGLNDALALSAANISVTFADSPGIAINSSGVIVKGDLVSGLPVLLKMSSALQHVLYQNLGFSLLYNVLLLPLAVTGVILPVTAALAMSGSSAVVLLNSFRLFRRQRPQNQSTENSHSTSVL